MRRKLADEKASRPPIAPSRTTARSIAVHAVVNSVDTAIGARIRCGAMRGNTAPAAVREESPRLPLDQERILSAAEAIVAGEGVGKLTMRRIGAELGADPTAVYRHFRNKDELLKQLADRMFGTLPEVDPALDWRDQLKVDLRHGLDRYRTHPDLAALLAKQPVDTPN